MVCVQAQPSADGLVLVQITDFGGTKGELADGSQKNRGGSGTKGYRSPEQVCYSAAMVMLRLSWSASVAGTATQELRRRRRREHRRVVVGRDTRTDA